MKSQVLSGLFRILPKPRQAVFICGCGHSGTTLLARILATHPLVFSVPYETNAFTGRGGRHWLAAFGLFCRAKMSGRPVLVEKTPRHVLHGGYIRALVPGAKFVVVTRDGRDVVNSLGKRYGNYDKALKRWMNDASASIDMLQAEDSYWWRHEDLIENPHSAVENLCNFIGIPFYSGMLKYYQKPIEWGRRGQGTAVHAQLRNDQVNMPIVDTRGKWKDELPNKILNIMNDGRSKDILNLLNY